MRRSSPNAAFTGPYGLNGGDSGKSGRNLFFRNKDRTQRCFLVVKMKSAQNPETESVSKLLEEGGFGKADS